MQQPPLQQWRRMCRSDQWIQVHLSSGLYRDAVRGERDSLCINYLIIILIVVNVCALIWIFCYCCRLIWICVIQIPVRTARPVLILQEIITAYVLPIGRARTALDFEDLAQNRHACVSSFCPENHLFRISL